MRTLPAVLLLILACASPASRVPPERIAALKEAEEPQLAACKLLGRFEGTSAEPAERGMEHARLEAREQAARAGATHIAVGREWQSPDVAVAAVKAYDCSAVR